MNIAGAPRDAHRGVRPSQATPATVDISALFVNARNPLKNRGMLFRQAEPLLYPRDDANYSQWGEFIAYIYAYTLGRSVDDDPEGVDFWHGDVMNPGADPATVTPGAIVQRILDAATGARNTHFDAAGNCTMGGKFGCRYDYQFGNQNLMLEAAVRLQRGRPANKVHYQDLQTLLRRVTDNPHILQ